MNFEDLANELILGLFEYFDGLDVLRAFYGLNSRLNKLLGDHCRAYHFNFRSISRRNFHLLCDEYLPFIVDQVISLRLSGDDETPNLPELLLSRGLSLNQFNHLKSLSLYSIHTFHLLNQMMIQCRDLRYLRHLSISHFYTDYTQNLTTTVIDEIWNLPLTHCRFEEFYSGVQCFLAIRTVSKSMRYLTIDGIGGDFDVLYHLLEYTPNLRQLSISTDYNSDDEQGHSMTSLIQSLTLTYEGSILSMTNLFQNLPNLSYLTLRTSNIYLNGDEWKQIIVDDLPQIKHFRLRMNFQFANDSDPETQVNQLLQTFRSDFWLKEHQWFVQCDWNPLDSFHRPILYTLPCSDGDVFPCDTTRSQSTCPNTTECSSDHVNTRQPSISTSLTAKFDQTDTLEIDIPFSDGFWSCFSSPEQLKFLAITIHEDWACSQLQLLLARLSTLINRTSHCLPSED